MTLYSRDVIDWHPQAGLAPRDEHELADLQANILRAHARNSAAAVYVRFMPGLGGQWVRRFRAYVTNAAEQLKHSGNRYSDTTHDPGPLLTLALSAHGYRALGIPRASWPDGGDGLFSTGMSNRQDVLGDPAPAGWDEPYNAGFDAMVLVASDNADDVDDRLRNLFDARRYGDANVVGVERLLLLWNAQGEAIEHFGFVDGRSQPRFFSYDVYNDRARNKANYWTAAAPLGTVLVPDPLGQAQGGSGSYLVVRKLEQDVRAFKAAERELANGLGLPASSPVAGAMLLGRDRWGRPVGSSATEPTLPVDNGFLTASLCPVSAHTRIMNPRTGREAPPMARRGMLYGRRPVHPDDAVGLDDYPTGGVGLLFMANVSDIESQFEALQSRANGGFGQPFDPVIGQGGPVAQSWTDPQRGRTCELSVGGYVTMRGGEYLFMPSLTGLATI